MTRLDRLWAMTSRSADSVLVYGDLKPEHVVFEHHAAASERPMLIDPGMSYASATDTVNILTTYLSAPAGLPLPTHAVTALSQVRTIGALVDGISAELATGTDPQTVWRLGLAQAVGRAWLADTA